MNKLQILGLRFVHAGHVAGCGGLLLLGLMAGCGQKGPLYLAPAATAATPAAPALPAATAPERNEPATPRPQ